MQVYQRTEKTNVHLRNRKHPSKELSYGYRNKNNYITPRKRHYPLRDGTVKEKGTTPSATDSFFHFIKETCAKI